MTVNIKAILLLLALGFVSLVICGAIFLHRFNETMTDVYTAMGAGGLLARYVEETGSWPTGWDQLQEYEEARLGTSQDENFAVYRERIGVKWDVDLKAAATAASHTDPPYPLVWCYSGEPPGPTVNHDANLMIYQVLTSDRGLPATEQAEDTENP